MSQAESVAFLTRVGNEWTNLKEQDIASYEEKCKHLKKEFKNKIKEFLMVRLRFFDIVLFFVL